MRDNFATFYKPPQYNGSIKYKYRLKKLVINLNTLTSICTFSIHFQRCCKVVVEPLYGPKWPMGPVLNSSFLSMKRLGVLLLPPGWDASPLQGYPQHICWYPFVHLGEEKHCESKVSCLRTQHNNPSQGLNPDHLIRS